MRAESDLQGHYRSEAPACHHCGLPLLEGVGFCPFCERSLDEDAGRTAAHAPVGGRRIAGVSERVLLVVGLSVFALVAAACITLALAA